MHQPELSENVEQILTEIFTYKFYRQLKQKSRNMRKFFAYNQILKYLEK